MRTSIKLLCAMLCAALLLSSCGENPLDWLNGNSGSTGTLSGSVILTNTNGLPIMPPGGYGGVKVTLEGTNLSATTSSDGAWSITGVPKGIYTISFLREGYSHEKVFSYQFIGSGEAGLPTQRMSSLENWVATEVSFMKAGGPGIVRFSATFAPTSGYVFFLGKDENVSHLPGSHAMMYICQTVYVDPSDFFKPGERIYAVAYPVTGSDYWLSTYWTGKNPADFPEYFETLSQWKSEVVSLVY